METETEQQEAQKNLETENTNSETVTEETVNNDGDELTPEQIEDLKKKASLSSQNYERWKKAEKEAEKLKKQLSEKDPKETENKPKSDLTQKDLYALISAQIPEDDVDEVVRAAKVLNKTISEALKEDVVQGILKTRAEHRKSAQATSGKGSRNSQKQRSDEDIKEAASKGDVPEKGSADAERLFWARRGGKRT